MDPRLSPAGVALAAAQALPPHQVSRPGSAARRARVLPPGPARLAGTARHPPLAPATCPCCCPAARCSALHAMAAWPLHLLNPRPMPPPGSLTAHPAGAASSCTPPSPLPRSSAPSRGARRSSAPCSTQARAAAYGLAAQLPGRPASSKALLQPPQHCSTRTFPVASTLTFQWLSRSAGRHMRSSSRSKAALPLRPCNAACCCPLSPFLGRPDWLPHL